jgi:hypothetical protein
MDSAESLDADAQASVHPICRQKVWGNEESEWPSPTLARWRPLRLPAEPNADFLCRFGEESTQAHGVETMKRKAASLAVAWSLVGVMSLESVAVLAAEPRPPPSPRSARSAQSQQHWAYQPVARRPRRP